MSQTCPKKPPVNKVTPQMIPASTPKQRGGKLIRIKKGTSEASLRSAPLVPGYLKGNLIRTKEGASEAPLRSAPSAPGHLKGTLRSTLHTAMQSWRNRGATIKLREATGPNGNGAESEATGKPQTGSHGTQRPRSRKRGDGNQFLRARLGPP